MINEHDFDYLSNSGGCVVVAVGYQSVLARMFINTVTQDALLTNPISVTTRKRRKGECADVYRFISIEEFQEMIMDNRLVDYVTYRDSYFGIAYQDITDRVSKMQNVIINMGRRYEDAIHLKEKHGDNIYMLFVDGNDQKEELSLTEKAAKQKCYELSDFKIEMLNLNNEKLFIRSIDRVVAAINKDAKRIMKLK